jgi:predicted  nucleic acid-binding Zn-ribbon protein
MRTRTCMNCGEQYESEARTDMALPFCSAWCRRYHHEDEEGRLDMVYEAAIGQLSSVHE